MIEITLEGLNARQKVLADMIWACDSKADVENFIMALGSNELRREAETIVDMLLMATIEQAYDGIGIGSMDQANELINKVK
jgi:hypothetical protein